MNNPFPKQIRRLGIAAPASKCSRKKLRTSLALIRSFGIEPVLPEEELFEGFPLPYLAAPDARRAACLNALIHDPSIDAIQCVRGGYGTPRILPMIDWDAFRKRPDLPLIGFSDITALHFAMLAEKAGIPVAAQMTAALSGAMENTLTRRSMRRALNAALCGKDLLKKCGPRLIALNGRPCDISAPVITGNLSLAAALCGTKYMPDFSGCVLVLEDVGEKVRILDRMLHQLLLAGVFDKAAALVFGQFTECPDTRCRNFMLREFAGKLEIPVFSGFRFGHDIPSVSIVCGESCRILPDGSFLI